MVKLLTGWLEMRDAWRSSAKVDCFLRSELETNFVVEEPCCDPEVAEAVVQGEVAVVSTPDGVVVTSMVCVTGFCFSKLCGCLGCKKQKQNKIQINDNGTGTVDLSDSSKMNIILSITRNSTIIGKLQDDQEGINYL